MKFESIDECTQALYGVLSFLKNTVGYDQEANLIEQAMHSLNVREGEKDWEAERDYDAEMDARREAEAERFDIDPPEESYPPDEGSAKDASAKTRCARMGTTVAPTAQTSKLPSFSVFTRVAFKGC